MNEYTASNEIQVRLGGHDLDFKRPDMADWMGLCGDDVVDAVREFFQAEADERLGRWRWPENPDYVVYHSLASGDVRVVDELTGYFTTHTALSSERFMDYGGAARVAANAARAFFDAQPEPKTWHDAVEGEVWALTVGEDTETRAWMTEGDGPRFWRGGHSIDRLSGSITAGRRIWPEAVSS